MTSITTGTLGTHLTVFGHRACTMGGNHYVPSSQTIDKGVELVIICVTVQEGIPAIKHLRFNLDPELDVTAVRMCTFGSSVLLAVPRHDHPLEFFVLTPETGLLKKQIGPSVFSRTRFSMIEVAHQVVLLCGGDFVRACQLLNFTNGTLTETGRLPHVVTDMLLLRMSADLIAVPSYMLSGHFPADGCLFYTISTGMWHTQRLDVPRYVHYSATVLTDSLIFLMTPQPQRYGPVEFRGYIYNTRSGTVYRMERPDFPTCEDALLFIHEGRFYVVGGHRGRKPYQAFYSVDLDMFITFFRDTELRAAMEGRLMHKGV